MTERTDARVFASFFTLSASADVYLPRPGGLMVTPSAVDRIVGNGAQRILVRFGAEAILRKIRDAFNF